MDITVKAFLQRADSSIEVRRIPMTLEGHPNINGAFNIIATKVANAFPDLTGKVFTLMWQDSDGDYILMSSDEEVQEALTNMAAPPLKVYITVEGDKEAAAPQDESEMEGDKDGDKGGNHNQDPFSAFIGMACPPPPPPGFMGPPPPPCGPPMGFHGRRCNRKRGFPGPPGGPFFGHHMGMHGHFMGRHGHGHPPFFQGIFGGPFHGGPMEGHHGHHHHGHHGGKGGWRANLRESVPVAHRRWAKAYIRDWRVANLKNATTTSSDSEQGPMTMEEACVPEAYARWLDILLPNWHRKQSNEEGQQKMKKMDDGTKWKDVKEERKKLKDSVPKEFRKWAKWYLSRRFGEREAPRFRKGCFAHHDGENKFPMAGKCGKKEWKKGGKMQCLRACVPGKHRVWAKSLILQWRLENKLAEARPGFGGVTSSESEDTDKEPAKGEINVPEDYARWLRKFLPIWHTRQGHLDGQKEEMEKGGMGEFKDTVPMEFRQWVRCFLWRRYGNKRDNSAQKYHKWLRAFQQKWIQEQGQDSEGEKGLSSDDDIVILDSETEKEVAQSMKHLRLMEGKGEQPANKGEKNVRFEAGADGKESGDGEKQDTKTMMDSSDGEGADNSRPFQRKVQPAFRHWAREAMQQWDGKTLLGSPDTPTQGGATGDNSGENIPPHVYNWMAKMMMKTQMKRMKEEMKEAKREAKAAKKAQKFQYGKFN